MLDRIVATWKVLTSKHFVVAVGNDKGEGEFITHASKRIIRAARMECESVLREN